MFSSPWEGPGRRRPKESRTASSALSLGSLGKKEKKGRKAAAAGRERKRGARVWRALAAGGFKGGRRRVGRWWWRVTPAMGGSRYARERRKATRERRWAWASFWPKEREVRKRRWARRSVPGPYEFQEFSPIPEFKRKGKKRRLKEIEKREEREEGKEKGRRFATK